MWTVETAEAELFDGPGREEILARVFELRRWWTLRGGRTFHTLGCALYQDGVERRYFDQRVQGLNHVLREHFGAALERVRAFIADRVGGDVRWRPDLPLPGFHIFGADAIAVGETTAAPHFDMQFQLAGYAWEGGLDVLSVTVPLQVPCGGASLEFWPVDLPRYEDLCRQGGPRNPTQLADEYPMRRVWYEAGRPCVQRGLPLHRIGPSASVGPDDYRITLQCHAVRDGGHWVAYW